MKRNKISSESFKKLLIVLLSNIVNASNHKMFVLLSNQKCMTQTSLVNLYHYE